MRNIILAFAILLSTTIGQAASLGFADVQFGLAREQVIEELFAQGYDAMTQGSSDRVTIPIYKIGDLPVEVTFLFNKAGLFHSVEMRTGRIEAGRYAKVIEAARYMSEHMAVLHGQPVKRSSPRIIEIKNGFRSFYWEWNLPDLLVYTAITSVDGRYYSVGNITHKGLTTH